MDRNYYYYYLQIRNKKPAHVCVRTHLVTVQNPIDNPPTRGGSLRKHGVNVIDGSSGEMIIDGNYTPLGKLFRVTTNTSLGTIK